MNNWSRTFRAGDVHIDGYDSGVRVWTAIGDHARRAIGAIEINVDTANGGSTSRLYITSEQMVALAELLAEHAVRLESLADEASKEAA